MSDDIVPLSTQSSPMSSSSTSSDRLSASSRFRIENMYNLDKFKPKTWGQVATERFRNKTGSDSVNRERVSRVQHVGRFFRRHLPILHWLPRYKFKSYIISDIIAGMTVGIMNIPQGLSYAMLATLNPVYGLYMSFFPLLIYGFLGTSKHLAIGAVAIVSLLSGSVIERVVQEYPISNMTIVENGTDPISAYRVQIASSLALVVGLFQVLMGASGLGFISAYFSDTFISGYTCGSAVHVVVSQTKEVFGMTNVTKFDGLFKIPKSVYNLILRLPSSNWICFAISAACIIFLIACKEYFNPKIKRKIKIEFPSELLLIVFITLASFLGDFETNFKIGVLKKIPTGLPTPQLPSVSLIPYLIKDGLIISLISFSVSISLASLFARRHNYKIDSTQELYAIGFSNMFGSVWSCFPSAGSLSRSSLLESTGAKSQFASLFSSTIIIVVILWLAPLFRTLPKLCLASIILVSLKGLLYQVKDFFSLIKVNQLEALTWMVTFLSVVILNVDWGLLIGIGFNILLIVMREQFFSLRSIKSLIRYKYNNKSLFIPDNYVRVESDLETSKETSLAILENTLTDLPQHVKLFKIEHSIYFSNCEFFHENFYKKYGHINHHQHVKLISKLSDKSNEYAKSLNTENNGELTALNTTAIGLHRPLPDVILDFSAVNYVDTNGIKMLANLIEDFKKIKVHIYIVQAQESFIKIIYRMGLTKRFDGHVYVTIDDALARVKEKLGYMTK